MTDHTNQGSDGITARPPSRPVVNPRPRTRPGTAAPDNGAPQDAARSAAEAHGKRAARSPGNPHQTASGDGQATLPLRPGKARRDDNGKWQATGDYEVGFGRPPVATRFAGKPGPGRPKSVLSYDDLLRKHLGKKRKLPIDGRTQSLTHAELIIMTTIHDAVKGKSRDARRQMLAEMARMMPAAVQDSGASARDLNEADRLTFEEFYQQVREEVLAELASDPNDGRGDHPEDDIDDSGDAA